ncbi:MAG: hypothetical protein DI630_33600 [Gordonia sp. (in: high G+C Gram-positive bacteria)]|nr:MAG: hypothetical protein DI630_33600 [Gordonia sp. (in: high G+C Gram-positive bacteria)]
MCIITVLPSEERSGLRQFGVASGAFGGLIQPRSIFFGYLFYSAIRMVQCDPRTSWEFFKNFL